MSERPDDIIRKEQEIDTSVLIIDNRSLLEKLNTALCYPQIPMVSAVVFSIIGLLVPALFIPLLLIQLYLWYAPLSQPDALPLHMPYEANKEDINDPKVGRKYQYEKARGGFLLGWIISEGAQKGMEVWSNFTQLMAHFLIFGTTGSGKTESIVSLLVNSLAVGSGFIFNDAKAAPKAMLQIATFCRIFGRDDDMRVINYISGGYKEDDLEDGGDKASRKSNDLAMFATVSGDAGTQLLTSLMSQSGGDNKIFQERAIALVSAVMPALTTLRDKGIEDISPATVRTYMAFAEFVNLYRNPHISKKNRDALEAYFKSLSGYMEDKSLSEQPDEVTKQFGFAQAYFTRILSSLTDTYGHIYLVPRGEVDWKDSVLNGRCVITLLPSLEKSGDELSSLGRIIQTGIRNAMGVGLGSVFEGSAEDIAYRLPTNAATPYVVANDENAYLMVEGQEMQNAQARGLGFCIITGTQDAPGMLETISKTTKQIMANSAFKQIQKIDDKETVSLAVEFAGEATVLSQSRFERRGLLGRYHATKEVSVERRNRLSSTAVRSLETGQAYLLIGGNMHKMQVFNHGISEKKTPDPKDCWLQTWYPVRLAKVRMPTPDVIKTYRMLVKNQPLNSAILLVTQDYLKKRKLLEEYFRSKMIVDRVEALTDASAQWEYDGLIGQLRAANDSINQFDKLHKTFELIAKNKDYDFLNIALRSRDMQRLSKEVVATLEQQDLNAEIDPLDANEQTDRAQAMLAILGDGFGELGVDVTAQSNATEGAPTSTTESEADPSELTDDLLLAGLMGAPVTPAAPTPTPASQPTQNITHDEMLQLVSDDWLDDDADLNDETVELKGVAKSVFDMLPMMPWFAGDMNEAKAIRKEMVQAEMFITGESEEQAQASADRGLEMLAESMQYPKTVLPDAKEMDLKGLLDIVRKGDKNG